MSFGCSVGDGPVAQAVERDGHHVLGLLGLGGGDLGDPSDDLDDLREIGVSANGVGVLGAIEQWLTGPVQRCSAGLEERRVAVEVLQEFLGEGLLGGQVADQPVHPSRERIPWRESVELGRRAAQIVDLVDVDGLEQGLPAGEVAIQGADPNLGAAGDLLQRGRGAALGERVPGGRDDLVVVTTRVARLGRWERVSASGSVVVTDGFCIFGLTNRRVPPL